MTVKFKSSKDWMQEIGASFRRLRIDSDLSQDELSRAANVSIGAVKNLESGKGASLSTMVKVVRALRREEWFGLLDPHPVVNPMQILRDRKLNAPRSRVSRKRGQDDDV